MDASTFTVDAMKSFIKKWKEGTLKPHYVSAPRPLNDMDPEYEGVTMVVADSLNEIVLNENKIVLMNTFNNESPEATMHIATLAKVIQQLDCTNIVVANFSMEENEMNANFLPSNGAVSLPIVSMWLPGQKKNSVLYEEVYSGKGLLDFIHSHAEKLSVEGVKFDLEKATSILQSILNDRANAFENQIGEVWDVCDKYGATESLMPSTSFPAVLTSLGYEDSLVEAVSVMYDALPEQSADYLGQPLNRDAFIAAWKVPSTTLGQEVDPADLVLALKQELSIPAAASAGVCTYTVTEDDTSMKQQFFWCITCSADPGTGCCAACALACHDGHDVCLPNSNGRAAEVEEEDEKSIDNEPTADHRIDCYCDCGAGGMPSPCKILNPEGASKKKKTKKKKKSKK